MEKDKDESAFDLLKWFFKYWLISALIAIAIGAAVSCVCYMFEEHRRSKTEEQQAVPSNPEPRMPSPIERHLTR